MNYATISLLTGSVLTLTLMISINGIFVTNSLCSGFEEQEGWTLKIHVAMVFPETVPCINAGSNAEGDENRVNLEGIVFP